jgi:hypothetical protein
VAAPQPGSSSRTSRRAAGWDAPPGRYTKLMEDVNVQRNSWFNPRTIWKARNQVLAGFSDPTDELRRLWLEGVPRESLTLDRGDLSDFSFLLIGDTGEGDHSQYALIPGLESQQDGTAFLFICSDVLYPLGDVNDYGPKFYRPYSTYPGPIYAIPGNHDWYDGLEGFMRHFCGREPHGKLLQPGRPFTRAWLRRVFWRDPSDFDADGFETVRALRPRPEQRVEPPQPGPYFAIDTEHVLLVGIDTGLVKRLDRDQIEWLVDVSSTPKPKVLLTGTPLIVNGEVHPVPFDEPFRGFASVDDVVRAPEHDYRAAIGGDIHNYQRYPVRIGDRTIQYVVSGGGGAFMHGTHSIPKVDETKVGATEDDFKCYPLRRDSLAAYTHVIDRRLPFRRRVLAIEPEEAAAYLRDKLGVTPLPGRGPVPTRISRRARVAGSLVRAARGEKGFHKWLSPFFDWDRPPFFKHFLRCDVTASALTITCFGVTGAAEHEDDPAVEDRVEIPLRD